MVRSPLWCRSRRAVARFCLLVAAATLPALASAGPLSAQEVTLSWQFRAGEVLEYDQTLTSHTGTPMGAMTQTQTTRMRQEVLHVAADGAANVRTTFMALRMVSDGPMGRQEYDSERDEEPTDPGLRAMAGMVGATLEMSMGPRGEVRSVSGMAEFIDRLMAGFGDQPGVMDAEVRAMFDRMFGEEAMTAQMQQGLPLLPTTPLRPGDTWSGEMEVLMPMGVARTSYVYRLDDVVTRDGRRVAVVALTGTTGPLEMDPDNPMAGMMEFSGGDMTGSMEFDVDRGVLLRMAATSTVEASTMGMAMQVETVHEMALVELQDR